MMTEPKPLKPLDSGVVLIVGTKRSNFSEELVRHPRIVMWDSQQEHWTNKDMPTNTRAVFMTRFIGHASFEKIVSEARKRHITIFNPMGTGTIIKQVKELLAIQPPVTVRPTESTEVKEVKTVARPINSKSVLHVFIPFMDFNLTNAENARRLVMKAAELNINTTFQSLAQYTMVQRKKLGIAPVHVRAKTTTRKIVTRAQIAAPKEELDVTVHMLDGFIKGLQDMRAFLIATTTENRELRARVEKFKSAMEGL